MKHALMVSEVVMRLSSSSLSLQVSPFVPLRRSFLFQSLTRASCTATPASLAVASLCFPFHSVVMMLHVFSETSQSSLRSSQLSLCDSPVFMNTCALNIAENRVTVIQSPQDSGEASLFSSTCVVVYMDSGG